MRRGWPQALGALALLGLLALAQVHTNQSLASDEGRPLPRLNPDAQLYYGLAVDLLAGGPYEDTVRRQQTLPPVGHPLWLAATRLLGASADGQARFAVWASLLLVAAAAAIATGQLLAAAAAVAIEAVYLAQVQWLAGNVETTIALAQGLLALTLAVFYRSRFSAVAGVAVGVVLALGLLVRPIHLIALHAATAVALLALAIRGRRIRAWPGPGALRGTLVAVATAQILLQAVGLVSAWRYGDSRLVSGTYSSYALYLGNSPHLEPEGLYLESTRKPEAFEVERTRFYTWPGDWQQRRTHFMGAVFEYWREQPLRAVRGWFWRLQRGFGLHGDDWAQRGTGAADTRALLRWGPWVHPAGTIALALLAVAVVVRRRAKPPFPSLGLTLGAGFALYVATHAVFAYVGFRYVSGAIPLLAAALPVLAWELVRGAETSDDDG